MRRQLEEQRQNKLDQQAKIKNALFEQMANNERKKEDRQAEIKLQGEVWKRDTQDFVNEQQRREQERKQVLKMVYFVIQN